MESGSLNLIELFFDGEATAEERASALRLLEQSPEARRWLAELEQMRAALALLPHPKIPRDCTSRVLSRAEQAQQAKRPTVAANEQANTAGTVVSRQQLWAALAVAAVALIVVVLPNVWSRKLQTDVALHQSPPQIADSNEKLKSAAFDDYLTKSQPEPAPGRAPGPGALSSPLGMGKASFEERDDALYYRKMTRKAGGSVAQFADEAMEQDRPAAVIGDKVSDATLRPASIAYVYDVATPEAQQAVLETFEKTLREQQIVLEDSARQADQASSAPPPLVFNRLGSSVDTRASAGVPGLQNSSQVDRSADCVYVVEATPLQLSNTISTLDNLAPRGGPAMADGPVAQPDATKTRQGRFSRDLSQQRPSEPSLQLPATTPVAADVKNSAFLSQAVRLPTVFDAPPTNEAASSPAAPSRAKSANVESGKQSELQGLPNPAAAAELRRAVIIFRVVPQ